MADIDFTAAAVPYALGVSVREHLYSQCFDGNEDDLVQAGVIRREWLPGKPGNNKSYVRVLLEGDEPRLLQGRNVRTPKDASLLGIRRKGKKGYTVSRRRSRDEIKRIERAQKLKQAREEETRMLAGLPSDPQEIRKRTFNFIVTMLGVLRDTVTNPRNTGGYAFGPEFLEELELAEDRLLDAVETCEVFLDATERGKAIAAIKRKVADADPEFSAFMSSTLALAKASMRGTPGGN